MNVLLWLGFALVNFFLIVLVYKLFGKSGLFAWIAMGTILANIQVLKSVDFDLGIITIAATLGNIMYGTLFLVTDALGEKYGHREAKKAVYIGFFSLISMVIVMQISLVFEPNSFDFAQDALETIFGIVPRIAIASLIAYAISQMLDVYLFKFLKEKTKEKDLWKRNIGSTVVSQLIDTIIFVPIAFLLIGGIPGGYPIEIVKEIFWTTYFIKVAVAAIDTPFVYLIKKITPIEESKELV
jgi:uncharacterized integral membrane protein (TIGR00697 family)